MAKNLAKKLGFLDGRPLREPDTPKYVKPSTKQAKSVIDDDAPVEKLGYVPAIVEPKYRMTSKIKYYDGVKLYQIKAIRDFDDVVAGQRGGYIEGVRNLSHDGNCWIAQQSMCYGDGLVEDDAWAMDYCIIKDDATLGGMARLFDNVIIKDRVDVRGNVQLSGVIRVGGVVYLDGDLVFDNQEALGAYLKAQYEHRQKRRAA